MSLFLHPILRQEYHVEWIQDNIRIAAAQVLHETVQVRQPVIRVQETQILAGRRFQAHIPGGAVSAVLLVDLPEGSGVALDVLPAHLGRVVRRPVIDDDHFQRIHQSGILENQGGQALVDIRLNLIDRDDNGQQFTFLHGFQSKRIRPVRYPVSF